MPWPNRANAKTRTESDAFGPLDIPADRLWGAQTERSLHNFRIGTERMPIELVHALGLIKRAAAEVNRDLGSLDRRRAGAIVAVAQDIADGTLDDHFPLLVWQTGSGTQTNMNVNEVIANARQCRARRRTRRENAGASERSRQYEPVVERLASRPRCTSPPRSRSSGICCRRSKHLHAALEQKGARNSPSIVKIGRTHTMDATPITLGQEFSGYAAQVKSAIAR